MRGGVDAARAAADHRDTVAGELVRELAGGVLSVMRRAPRTDHRDAVFVLRQHTAFHVKHDRRIVNLAEQLRVLFIILNNEPHAKVLSAFQLTGQVVADALYAH